MPETRKYSDRAEYLKQAVDRRRRKIKQMSIEYKGGKCVICGYNMYQGALEFHHLAEKTKSFGLSMNGLTRSWQKTKTELDKCVLICSNCHKEIHGGATQPPRVTEDGKTR